MELWESVENISMKNNLGGKGGMDGLFGKKLNGAV